MLKYSQPASSRKPHRTMYAIGRVEEPAQLPSSDGDGIDMLGHLGPARSGAAVRGRCGERDACDEEVVEVELAERVFEADVLAMHLEQREIVAQAASKIARRGSSAPSPQAEAKRPALRGLAGSTPVTPESPLERARIAAGSSCVPCARRHDVTVPPSLGGRRSGVSSATSLPSLMMMMRPQVACTSGRMWVERMTVFSRPSP